MRKPTDTEKYMFALKLIAFAIGSVLSHFGYGGENPWNIIPAASAGGYAPFPGLTAEYGWRDLLLSTERRDSRKIIPAFGELIQHFGRVHVHNPAGQYDPMAWDQIRRTREYAKRYPTDANIQARADIPAFLDAMNQLGEQGISRSIYTGGVTQELTASWKPGDTAELWAKRKLLEVWPFLSATDYLLVDAFLGERSSYPSEVKGEFGGFHQLILGIELNGVKMGHENVGYVGTPYMAYQAKLIIHRTPQGSGIVDMWAKHGVDAKTWPSRKVDEGEVPWAVGANGEEVFVFTTFKTNVHPSGTTKTWTEQERFDEIAFIHETMPRANIVIPSNYLSLGLLELLGEEL